VQRGRARGECGRAARNAARLGITPRLLTLAGCALLVLPQIIVIITSIDPSPAAIFPPKGISFEWY
jgi:ABC-type spermidine/putrescine transport system permease subunit II